MIKQTATTLVTALSLSTLLGACSNGAPTDDDLHQALVAQLDAQSQQLAKLPGGKHQVEVARKALQETRLENCAEDNGGYKCDAVNPGNQVSQSIRMVKGDDGKWSIDANYSRGK